MLFHFLLRFDDSETRNFLGTVLGVGGETKIWVPKKLEESEGFVNVEAIAEFSGACVFVEGFNEKWRKGKLMKGNERLNGSHKFKCRLG